MVYPMELRIIYFIILPFVSINLFAANQAKIEEIAKSCIEKNIASGVVVCAGDANGNTYTYAVGTTEKGGGYPLTADSIFDIASVSKAVGTASSLAICKDRGLINFDEPFTKYLPSYSAKLQTTPTVRQLSMHVSGFAGKPYNDAKNGKDMLRQSCEFSPSNKPLTKYEYACWNYILLGQILENISGRTLKEFASTEIFEPIGMTSTSFGKPKTKDESRLVKTINTQKAGQISDPHAFIIFRDGLCAGNAGVFSTANDLAKFCRVILNGGITENGKKIFDKSFIDLTQTSWRDESGVARSFGWDKSRKSLPTNFSDNSITHSGWSGQSVFIDLERKRYVVVLTVRLSAYAKSKESRKEIASLIFED